MSRRWAVRLWIALISAGGALAAPDEFVERLLAAQQLHSQGHYTGAETILLALLNGADRFGADDPRTAIVLNNLGSVYHFMNKYPKAEQCYRRAAESEARLWGTGGDRPIRSVINLAALYIETGQFAKAERLGLGSLAEHQPVSRQDHPDFARLLALLGDLEQRQGRYSEARKYYEQALAIFEKLAPDGSQTVETLNNLCVLYAETGNKTDALSCGEHVLRMVEGTRNVEPSTQARLLANVASFQFLVHGPADAEPFYKKALIVAENVPGGEHPLVAQILLSYAIVLERTSRRVQAKEFRRRAKAIEQAASTADPRKYTVDLGELLRKTSIR